MNRRAAAVVPVLVLLLVNAVRAQELTVVTGEYHPVNFTKDDTVTGSSAEIVKEILRRPGHMLRSRICLRISPLPLRRIEQVRDPRSAGRGIREDRSASRSDLDAR